MVGPERRLRVVAAAHANHAWELTGVRREVWERHPSHAFRYAFTSGLAMAGANTEAVERLIGHATPGARASYLDPRWALRLRDAVNMIPAIGAGAVISMKARR